MNVAIIGASGIGKHHAKWFHLEGCDVVAFSGTSDESCRKTEQVLRNMFEFQGRAYTDYRRMLDTESPDIVCVCTPHDCHLEQVRYALEADLNVYCEKPMTWPPFEAYTLSSHPPSGKPEVTHPVLRQTLDDTRSVVSLADQRNRVIGMNTQYIAAWDAYRSLYEKYNGPLGDIESFYFLLESKGISGRYGSYAGIWIDMSPHVLSQVIAWGPQGTFDVSHIDCRIMEHKTIAKFRYGAASVEAEMGKSLDSEMRRRLGINDFIVDYYGQADDQGIYRSYLRHGDDTVGSDDYMQLSVRRFIDAVRTGETKPLADGHAGLKNLELSMIILENSKVVEN